RIAAAVWVVLMAALAYTLFGVVVCSCPRRAAIKPPGRVSRPARFCPPHPNSHCGNITGRIDRCICTLELRPVNPQIEIGPPPAERRTGVVRENPSNARRWAAIAPGPVAAGAGAFLILGKPIYLIGEHGMGTLGHKSAQFQGITADVFAGQTLFRPPTWCG